MADNKKLVNGTGLAQGLQGVYTKAKGYADSVVENEKSRAEGIESGLDTRITALEGKFNGDESVDSKIAAAQAAAEAKAAELDNALKTDLEGQIAAAEKKHTDELAAARTAITAEIASAKSGAEAKAAELDEELHTTISGEVADTVQVEANRAAGEEAKIRTEFAAADIALHTEITGEIGEAVKDEEDRAKGEEARIEAAYKAADTALQQAIDAINNGENGVLASAKAYTDEKVEDEKERAMAAEQKALDDAKAYADEKIAELVDSAPEDLDTLNELAQSIKTHATEYDAYVTTVNNKIATAKQEAIDAAAADAAEKDIALHKTISAEIDADVKAEADRAKGEEARIEAAYKAADTALETAVKKYADDAVAVEKARAEGQESAIRGEFTAADETLQGAIDAVEEDIQELVAKDTELAGKITALETKVGEGSVADAVAGVRDALDDFIAEQEGVDSAQQAAIEAAQGDATQALADAAAAKTQADKGVDDAADAKAAADAVAGRMTTAEGEIDKLQQQMGVVNGEGEGSIKKALADAKSYAEGQDAALKTALQKEIDDDVKVVADDLAAEVTARKNADADLRSDVVNTFKALRLQFNEADGTAQVALTSVQMDGEVNTPIGDAVAIPVMTTEEVEEIVNGLQ